MATRMSQSEINQRAHSFARRTVGDGVYSKKLSRAFKEMLRQEREAIMVMEEKQRAQRAQRRTAGVVGLLAGAGLTCMAVAVFNGLMLIFRVPGTLPLPWSQAFVYGWIVFLTLAAIIKHRAPARAADWLRKKLRR